MSSWTLSCSPTSGSIGQCAVSSCYATSRNCISVGRWCDLFVELLHGVRVRDGRNAVALAQTLIIEDTSDQHTHLVIQQQRRGLRIRPYWFEEWLIVERLRHA